MEGPLLNRGDGSELMACIIHQRVPAFKVYQVRDTETGQMVRYGLCPMCDKRLRADGCFAAQISKTLGEKVDKIKGEKNESDSR